jgi:hypothetical protein
MCKSKNLQTVIITKKSGKMLEVPACNECGHYHFPDTHYAYIIHGLAKNWASTEDLSRTIKAILKEILPKEDTKELVVEVAELA